jgi:hypothetical protein
MKLTSAETLARRGIFVQFMALIRCLLEYFRLKYIHGGALTTAVVEPFITGSLIAALCAWIAVICYFLRRYKTVVAVSAGTVVILLAYKIYAVR